MVIPSKIFLLDVGKQSELFNSSKWLYEVKQIRVLLTQLIPEITFAGFTLVVRCSK